MGKCAGISRKHFLQCQGISKTHQVNVIQMSITIQQKCLFLSYDVIHLLEGFRYTKNELNRQTQNDKTGICEMWRTKKPKARPWGLYKAEFAF